MKDFLRFSISGVFGIIITAALFVTMLGLLSGKKSFAPSTDTDINFSFVKDYKPLEQKPPNTPQEPVRQEVSQPPAAPNLIHDSQDADEVTLPDHFGLAKDMNIIDDISIPGVGSSGTFQLENNGGLKAGIAPMYPPDQLMKKTEGWVEVLITVNEFGLVSAVKVLQAEPRRVFNAAATKAVRKWKFHPKEVNGQAVTYQVTQKIEFKVNE